MSLREELKAIEVLKMQDVARFVMPEHFVAPEEAHAQEIVLQREYSGMYESVIIARSYSEVMGLSEYEAALVAGGMVLQLALLKTYAETETVEQVDLNDSHD